MSSGKATATSAPASAAGGARPRREPVRTCAGCGRRAPKREMRRFGLAADGTLEWRRTAGRGSYLHPARACAREFVLRKKFVPGLRARVGRGEREALVGDVEHS